MTHDEIMKLDIEQIEARSKEILAELDEADAEQIEALNQELDSIEARRAEIKKEIEQRRKDVKAVIEDRGKVIETVKSEEVNDMEVRNTREYIDAYAEYIKSGDPTECRTLTTTNDTTPNGTGTVAVPDLVYEIVKTAWDKEGIMRLVKKTYLKGNLDVQFEISGDEANDHAEGAGAVNEENLVLGTVALIPQEIIKWISISRTVYALRGEQFLRYIYDELTYRIAKKAANKLIAKIEACGTVSTTTCPGVPKVTAASVGVGTVAAAMAELSDEAENPVVMMHKGTWGTFKAAQYANGYGVDPFEGLPVVFNNSIKRFSAATTGETYAIVGDLGHGSMANFPEGNDVHFLFDELTKKKEGKIEVSGDELVALGVVAPNAFVKITK